MPMNGAREDYLHFLFRGEHVLTKSLPLDSFAHFFWGSLLTVFLCLSERALTFAIAKRWNPFPSVGRSRARNALWRSALHWVVTLTRLLYMLIAMSYNIGLILVTATAIAGGQFVIEYMDVHEDAPESRSVYNSKDTEPLLSPSTASLVPETAPTTRPRSKSKPDAIFIHPTQSNIARADAVALEMGLSGETERVKGLGHAYPPDDDGWELGKGQGVARQLLGSSRRV
ncbi:hypothetical protein PLICRDRAFT_49975 [Plicaturopsis crispa FD-325 SS-3]|nr:hypothetical protein PLICRDRAFT_49975 [Plicaturopsis crispa FD-325 SS-3]